MKDDPDDSVIFPQLNTIKRALDDHPRFATVLYAIANMNLDTEKYHDCHDSVHVDEKLVFLMQRRSYLCISCLGSCHPTDQLNTRVKS
jgi:hypothetical protein